MRVRGRYVMQDKLKTLTDLIGKNDLSLESFKAALKQAIAEGLDPGYVYIPGDSNPYNSLLGACMLNPTEQNFEIFKYLVEEKIVQIEDQLSADTTKWDTQNYPSHPEEIKKFLNFIDVNTTDEQKNKFQFFNIVLFFNHTELFKKLLNNPIIKIDSEGQRHALPIEDIVMHEGRPDIAKLFIESKRFAEAGKKVIGEDVREIPERMLFEYIFKTTPETFNLALSPDKLPKYRNFNREANNAITATPLTDKQYEDKYIKLYSTAKIDSLEAISNRGVVQAAFMPEDSKSVYIMLLFLNNPTALRWILQASDVEDMELPKTLYLLECVRDLKAKGLDLKHIAKEEHVALMSDIGGLSDRDLSELLLSLNIEGDNKIEDFCVSLSELGAKPEVINRLKGLMTELYKGPKQAKFAGLKPIETLNPIALFTSPGLPEKLSEFRIAYEVNEAKEQLIQDYKNGMSPVEANKKMKVIATRIAKDNAYPGININPSDIEFDLNDLVNEGVLAIRRVNKKRATDLFAELVGERTNANLKISEAEQKLYMTNLSALIQSPDKLELGVFKELLSNLEKIGFDPNGIVKQENDYKSLLKSCLLNPTDQNFEIFKYLIKEGKANIIDTLNAVSTELDPQKGEIPDPAKTKKFLEFIDEHTPTMDEKNKCQLFNLALFFNQQKLFEDLLNNPAIEINQYGERQKLPFEGIFMSSKRPEIMKAFLTSDRFNERETGGIDIEDPRIIGQALKYTDPESFSLFIDKLKGYSNFALAAQTALTSMMIATDKNPEIRKNDKAKIITLYNNATLNSFEVLSSNFVQQFGIDDSLAYNRLLFLNEPSAIDIVHKSYNKISNPDKPVPGMPQVAKLTYILECVRDLEGLDFYKISKEEHVELLKQLSGLDVKTLEGLTLSLNIKGETEIKKFCDNLGHLVEKFPHNSLDAMNGINELETVMKTVDRERDMNPIVWFFTKLFTAPIKLASDIFYPAKPTDPVKPVSYFSEDSYKGSKQDKRIMHSEFIGMVKQESQKMNAPVKTETPLYKTKVVEQSMTPDLEATNEAVKRARRHATSKPKATTHVEQIVSDDDQKKNWKDIAKGQEVSPAKKITKKEKNVSHTGKVLASEASIGSDSKER